VTSIMPPANRKRVHALWLRGATKSKTSLARTRYCHPCREDKGERDEKNLVQGAEGEKSLIGWLGRRAQSRGRRGAGTLYARVSAGAKRILKKEEGERVECARCIRRESGFERSTCDEGKRRK